MGEHADVRQLTAVVMADIVGSSVTLERTGVAAAVAERARLASIARDVAADAGGHVVADEGDAAVLACRSTVDAVTMGAAIINAANDESFDVRVGVTIGELSVNPNGGFGRPDDDVMARVASIQSAGPVGGVTVDGPTRRALLGSTGCEVEALRHVAMADGGVLYQLLEPPAVPQIRTELDVAMLVEFAGPPGPVAEVAQTTQTMVAPVSVHSSPHGSGLFAVFDSCCRAVEVAAQIHHVVATGNIEGQRPALVATVSLAMGEVAAGVDDRFGRPVVEAARLLAHAGGGTAINGDIRALAGGVLAEAVDLVGNRTLKGLSETSEVYRVAPRPATALVDLPPALARSQRFAFVGREDDLATLSERWSSVVEGDMVGVVVTGEEGAGKTRLAAELAAQAGGVGATVLFGACDEDLRQPYLPVTTALAAAAPRDPLIAEAVNGLGSMASAFGNVVPEGARAERVDVFDAVSSAVVRLAQRRPLLLIIDDVQWATPETVQLLEHILACADARSVMVVTTCRSEDVDRDHPVRQLLASSKTVHRVAQLRLGRLSEHDVVAMLEGRAERALDAEERSFAATITEVAGGSPLFIEELLVHLSSTGALVHDGSWRLGIDVGELPLPDSILELMRHRIERLGDDAAYVMAVGAVAGSSFDPLLVASVAERPIGDVVDAIDAAVVAGLLRSDDVTGSHRFGDEMTRQAALRFLGAGRRSLLHGAIARSLESDDGAPDALAYHWEAAGGGRGLRRAVDHLKTAADRDMAAAAWESAIARLRHAVELLDKLQDQGDRIRGEISLRLGASLRMIGDEAHRPDVIAAAACARRLGDAAMMAGCALAMMRPGAWYTEAGVVDAQISEMCEDALMLLADDDPLRPQVLATFATNLSYDPDIDRRWALVRQSQAAAERLGDPRAIGVAGAAELIACQEPDLVDRRWELAQQVQNIGRATGDRELSFTGAFFVMLEHLARGDIERVEAMSLEVAGVAEDMGGYWPRFLASHIEALLAVARSEPEASAMIERERSRFEHHPVDALGVSVIQQAGIAMSQGTLSGMLLPFTQAVDKYREMDDWTKKWNFVFAVAHLEAGDLDEASAWIEADPDPDVDRYWLPSMCQLGRVGLVLGHRGYCERVLRELEPYRNRFAVIGVGAAIPGQVSTALGQAALGLDDAALAVSYFREALTQAERAGFPYFETVARRFLATALLQLDNEHDEVARLLDRVEDVAARYGFAIELAAAEKLREAFGQDCART